MERRYLPDPEADRGRMEELQRKVSDAAVFENRLEATDLVAGVDQAFDGDEVVSAAVALQEGEVVDRSVARRDVEYPYVPGLLAFREAPAAVDALSRLEVQPDVVLVDGSGRIHPRHAGLATHVGVVLDLPTVGVAKDLLCGEPVEDVDVLEEGERVAVMADDGVDAPEDAVIGYAYQSRQYADSAGTSINPLYVSPGHMVGADTAVDLVADACDGYKLPEPVRLADALADEEKTG